jgi:hypothetical protein
VANEQFALSQACSKRIKNFPEPVILIALSVMAISGQGIVLISESVNSYLAVREQRRRPEAIQCQLIPERER